MGIYDDGQTEVVIMSRGRWLGNHVDRKGRLVDGNIKHPCKVLFVPELGVLPFYQQLSNDDYWFMGYVKAAKPTKAGYFLRRIVHGRLMGYPWIDVLAFAIRHRKKPEVWK